MNVEHLISHVLPMIVRAYDDNDARIQEEVLRKSVFLAKQLDVQVTVILIYFLLFSYIFLLFSLVGIASALILIASVPASKTSNIASCAWPGS